MRQSTLHRAALAAAALALAAPAAAQDLGEGGGYRYRIGAGPQVYPSYPGSDDVDVGPFLEFERARDGEQFDFGAPDDSFGLSLVETDGFSFGPIANYEGTRDAADVGAAVPEIDFTIEVGGFVEINAGEHVRLRTELRKGLGGHKGWTGSAAADFVLRDGDDWLFSIGPRLTWSNDRYHEVWFGVTPATATATGIAAYDPGGGVQAWGATATFLTQLGPHWGLITYAKYDRLVGDAADSPLVAGFGSRDQLSGGVALTYTFGQGVE